MRYMKTLKTLISLAVILPVLAFATSPSMAAEKLRFGLLPAEDAIEMVRQFQGIADHVSKAVGMETEIFVSQSYNALIEAMEAGKIDVAYLGAGTYVAAYLKGFGIVPMVVTKLHGRTYYKSCIITRADSGLQTLSDLKGKTFAFVSPTSTSGGIGPRYYLGKNGINPEADFEKLIYAGKHDAVFFAVKNGKVDAGATADAYFSRWKDRGILNFEKWDEPNDNMVNGDIRVLGCQKVPSTLIAARKALGEEMIEKMVKALVTIPNAVLDKLRIWGVHEAFIRTNHAFFEEFLQMKLMAAKMKKKK